MTDDVYVCMRTTDMPVPYVPCLKGKCRNCKQDVFYSKNVYENDAIIKAPLMRKVGASVKIYESETAWLTETQSGEKYLCVSKDKFRDVWVKLRKVLLQVGSISYKDASKDIVAKEQIAWVSFEVFFYMSLIKWENAGRKTMISLTEKGKNTEQVP